jgi:amino acid transporter
MGFIILSVVVNIFGLGSVANSSSVLTFITILPFVVFVGTGLSVPTFNPQIWISTQGEWKIGEYLSVLLWATCGFEFAGFLAGDVQKPKKTFPLAMALTILLMSVTYLFPIAVGLAIADTPEEFVDGAYPVVATEMGYGTWLAWVLAVGAVTSSLGTYISYLYTSTKALASMAEDGNAPFFFKYKTPRFESPWVAILFYGTIHLGLINIDFTDVVEIDTVLYTLQGALLFITLIRLRFSQPNLDRPFKIPTKYILPIGISIPFFAIGGFNIWETSWQIKVMSLGVLIFGILLFGLIKLREWYIARRATKLAYQS